MGDTKSIGIAYRDQDIDGGTIGATTPSTGRFTTLSATSLSAPTMTASGDLYIKSATVAATGSTQGDAAQLAGGFTLVTAADATKGVKLPAAVAGRVIIIKNADAANAVLKVYPATDDAINAIAANSAYSMAAKTSMMLVAYDSTTWYTLPLLAS
jgi:hypothetical protein